MLFLTKLVVLGKSVYQNAFLSFENRLNVDLSFSCLGSFTWKTKSCKETYSLPTPLNILLCNLPSFHKQYSNEKPFRASLKHRLLLCMILRKIPFVNQKTLFPWARLFKTPISANPRL